MFTAQQVDEFAAQGFIIVPSLASAAQCARLLQGVQACLNPPLAPVEFETDVQYPGAPADRLSPGGDTPRRLLHAYTRAAVFRDWARSAAVTSKVKQLLATEQIQVSQNHHNCIMTKYPGFSSSTSWHQDIRYWLFDQPNLVSVWLALGDENLQNGGLQLIPASHRLALDRGRYDAAYFLRQDLAENQALIQNAVVARLRAGDALFFHSGTFHAASRNDTDTVKISLVFTYYARDNQPIAGTRSAAYADIVC